MAAVLPESHVTVRAFSPWQTTEAALSGWVSASEHRYVWCSGDLGQAPEDLSFWGYTAAVTSLSSATGAGSKKAASVTVAQLCYCSRKQESSHRQHRINVHGTVPIKLYLQNFSGARFGPWLSWMPSPQLEDSYCGALHSAAMSDGREKGHLCVRTLNCHLISSLGWSLSLCTLLEPGVTSADSLVCPGSPPWPRTARSLGSS